MYLFFWTLKYPSFDCWLIFIMPVHDVDDVLNGNFSCRQAGKVKGDGCPNAVVLALDLICAVTSYRVKWQVIKYQTQACVCTHTNMY